MRLRLTKIDEYQLLTCLKHGLWGSQSARFKTWREGDHLAIIVEKSLAALAEVTGSAFISKDRVWDNGLFPHRIRLKFTHVLQPKDRPPILGEIREALTQEWGPRYGWAILNQRVLESSQADAIVKAISSKPNNLLDYERNLTDRLEEARIKREGLAKEKSRKAWKGSAVPEQLELTDERPESKREASAHTKIQSELIALGRTTGCSVWIASNDKGRSYGGKYFADDCLKKLPGMGLSEEATKRIGLIDVIWVNQNAPVCAFEIETSTSIYSGLLRMSDLLSVVPALKINIYIVAPLQRQDKVLAELSRPTFQKIGLSEYCRYIPSEALSELMTRVKGLGGHIQPTILDTIAITLEEEKDLSSP
ncbi:hypothetical protein EPO44_09230 [bacterium]|nr:MAG: hypothetical protein EPO44_09230 [bacterium]